MKKFSGGYCEEATPDPIPNSEVKLLSADGTAHLLCGRVGRRRNLFKGRRARLNTYSAAFFLAICGVLGCAVLAVPSRYASGVASSVRHN